jgi:hypothetical protein
MKKINKKEGQYAEVYYEFDVVFQEESNTEEGHGFHTFYDSEEINRTLKSATLLLENGEKIDIIQKLTKEEIKLIIDSYV